MLNLDLNNFGGGGQAWKEVFFFLIYSLYFLDFPVLEESGSRRLPVGGETVALSLSFRGSAGILRLGAVHLREK